MRFLLRVVLVFTGVHMALTSVALVSGRRMPLSDQLLYEVRTPRTSDIHLLDIDRRLSHNLTWHSQHVLDTRPIWSPDASKVVFESRRERQSLLYLLDTSDGTIRPLAPQLDANQYQPVWTEDSQSIIFQTSSRLDPVLYRIDLKTNTVQMLEEPRPASDTPSERLLVMVYRNNKWGIAVYEDDWQTLSMLTDNGVRFNEPPRWSLDEGQIALVSGEYGYSDIYVMNADGSDFRRVTADGSMKTNLTWRPS